MLFKQTTITKLRIHIPQHLLSVLVTTVAVNSNPWL